MRQGRCVSFLYLILKRRKGHINCHPVIIGRYTSSFSVKMQIHPVIMILSGYAVCAFVAAQVSDPNLGVCAFATKERSAICKRTFKCCGSIEIAVKGECYSDAIKPITFENCLRRALSCRLAQSAHPVIRAPRLINKAIRASRKKICVSSFRQMMILPIICKFETAENKNSNVYKYIYTQSSYSRTTFLLPIFGKGFLYRHMQADELSRAIYVAPRRNGTKARDEWRRRRLDAIQATCLALSIKCRPLLSAAVNYLLNAGQRPTYRFSSVVSVFLSISFIFTTANSSSSICVGAILEPYNEPRVGIDARLYDR